MKQKVIAVAAAFLLIVSILLYMTYQKNKPITLTFGMFAGSNWDVPNGESSLMKLWNALNVNILM